MSAVVERRLAEVVQGARRVGACLVSDCLSIKGYAVFGAHGTNFLVARLLLKRKLGRPLEDWEVTRHRCDNKACIEIEHLEVGTSYDNVQDRVRRGRSADIRGECNPFSKLTEADVLEIRRLYSQGQKQADVARQFGLDRSSVYLIVHRKTWTHI